MNDAVLGTIGILLVIFDLFDKAIIVSLWVAFFGTIFLCKIVDVYYPRDEE